MDAWSGYPAARDRLLGAVGTHAPGRTVVLTGDVHVSFVNELRRGFDRPDRPPVAAEFVGTSITSGGDGIDRAAYVERSQGENPHVRWHDARRGYMLCTASADEWRTDYRIVPFVTRPGAPIETRSRWRLRHGSPALEQV